MNFDHRKRFHTTGLCIAFSGKNNGIGFDRFDHRVWYHIVCTSLELVIVTAPAWSGVGFDAKENEYCTLDSGLSQVSVLGITMRCYQRGVGICFSSRRLNGFIIWPTLFFVAIASFFHDLVWFLRNIRASYKGHDPMRPARINCLEPLCCHSTNRMYFFSHSELSIGSSFCVQCAQIKGVESKIGC